METLKFFHVLSPATILTCYVFSSLWELFKATETASSSESSESSASSEVKMPKQTPLLSRPQIFLRSLQFLVSIIIGFLYIGEAVVLAHFSAIKTPTYSKHGTSDSEILFALFSSLLWILLSLSLFDVGANPKKRSFCVAWTTAAVFEILILGVGLISKDKFISTAYTLQIVLQSARITSAMALVASEVIPIFSCEPATDEETTPLLAGGNTENDSKGDTLYADQYADLDLQRISQNWWLYLRSFRLFLPIIRPRGLQQHLCVLGVFMCIALERFLNIFLPIKLGAIVSALGDAKEAAIPWMLILVYVGLMILDSSAGVHLARDLLWQPVEQTAAQRMKRASYDKLMSLSCDFHDSKKSDVTFQTIQRGSRITDLVETICFELFPMATDLLISISVFWYLFNGYVGFVVAVVVVLFIWSTLRSLSVRAKLWREFIDVWEREWYSLTESVHSWDTVSHFGRIPYEMKNYGDRTEETRGMQMKWLILSEILSSSRDIILIGGQGVGACIIAREIVSGGLKIGDFITFMAYWSQLSTPLHFFARGFNSISKGLVDAEKLLALFEKTPTVRNSEDAVPFVFKKGVIDFKNVSFSYDDKRTVTQEVTFRADPGKITAFVGETGCGKSTLFKLLFRFYDPQKGNILIDGQDIKDLSLDSFRDHIGIVPQEPALFNKSVRENLRYPDLNATDEEIEEACKAVSLHDKIISFTKGYDEVIGERGTKLSGGERQRIAIARAILKNPDILLLDEATSSVDSATEAQIQASLKTLCENRTTFVIAHRLSTIVNADQVIVMDDGKVAESGTHASLIKQNGPYRKLWTSQLSEHIGELRGKSASRSRCAKEDFHLLVNDLNSSDEDVKVLLANTIERESDTTMIGGAKSASSRSHVLSHEKQEERGRSPARSLRRNARSEVSTSTLPLPKPLQIDQYLPVPGHSSDSSDEGVPSDDVKVPKSAAKAAKRRCLVTHEQFNDTQQDGTTDDEAAPISSTAKLAKQSLSAKNYRKKSQNVVGIAARLDSFGKSTSNGEENARNEQHRIEDVTGSNYDKIQVSPPSAPEDNSRDVDAGARQG